jgi:uncharacterized lipoprotein YmbA
MLGQRRFGKIQMALLVVIALVMGATLISPAVGHVTKKVKHLYKHLDPRYVNVGEKASSAATADNAGLLDNIDSAGFLQTGSVLVRAQDDPTAGYINDNAGTVTINTVSITAPSAGFVIISGQVDVDNDTASEVFHTLDVTIDGVDATPNGKAMAGGTAVDAADAQDEISLAYTITRPITAGAHTILQRLSGVTDFDYDSNELTVLFVPTGNVARSATQARGSSASGNGDA